MEGSNTVIDNRPSVKVFYDCDHLSEASLNSRLGVGVGISKEGIVLQHEKLDKAAPLFKIKLYQTELFRKIGANAARLVKKMPFKVLD